MMNIIELNGTFELKSPSGAISYGTFLSFEEAHLKYVEIIFNPSERYFTK